MKEFYEWWAEFSQKFNEFDQKVQGWKQDGADHPNMDELLILIFDLGQQALDGVRRLLHKIG